MATAPVSTTTPKPDRKLTDSERCDRCGSRAYASVAVPGVVIDLYFCSHHWREFGPALRERGYAFIDETSYTAVDADLVPELKK